MAWTGLAMSLRDWPGHGEGLAGLLWAELESGLCCAGHRLGWAVLVMGWVGYGLS
jgi:hypothetical protein